MHRPFVPTDRDGEQGKEHRGRRGHADHFPDMVRYTDEIVGALLEALERTGQAKKAQAKADLREQLRAVLSASKKS